MRSFLELNAALLTFVWRIAVLILLVCSLWTLHKIRDESPSTAYLESMVSRIERTADDISENTKPRDPPPELHMIPIPR